MRANRWQHLSLRDRFMMKVDLEGPNGCWLWLASQSRGYGQINVGGVPQKAYRVAWELFRGPIPAGMSIDHLCRQPLCVNPDHLEVVTLAENTRRQLAAIGHPNALKTHCRNGHPYDDENTRFVNGVHRVCRICRVEANRRFRAKGRAA